MKMKNKIFSIILLFILLFSSYLFADAPDTLWTRTYGGIERDFGYSVQQTSDEGFIIVGNTESFGAGSFDFYIIKTDSNGDSLWSKTYGGNDDEQCFSAQLLSDGGLIIVGRTGSFGAGRHDVYIIRTNSNGDTLWTKTFGGVEFDGGESVHQTSDGGFFIPGYTCSFGAGMWDFYVIRTNSNGDSLWTKMYGEFLLIDIARSAHQTDDNGFIVIGETQSFGAIGLDAGIIRSDSNGDTLWVKTYGGEGNQIIYSSQLLSDGGLIMVGYTLVNSVDRYDVYLLRTNSNGDTLWTKTYGGADIDEGYSVQQTNDSGFIIAGKTVPLSSPLYDVYLIKTNSNGDTLWTKTIGGAENDIGESVLQTSDGGFIIAGYTESFGAGEMDVYLIRLDKDTTGIQDNNLNNFINPKDFIISYNNSNLISIRYTIQHSSSVNLSMYNISGQLVKTLFNEYKNAGDHFINFKTDNISAGVYYFKLTAGKSSYTQKAVVVR